MFHYTPDASIVRRLQHIRRNSLNYRAESAFWYELFAQFDIHNYGMQVAVRQHFIDTSFFSVTNRRLVPVGGFLIPSTMFDVAVVN